MRVIREAERRGIALRVIGAVALRINLPAESRKFHEQMLNRELSDIDYASYSKHTVEVKKIFKESGDMFGMRQ